MKKKQQQIEFFSRVTFVDKLLFTKHLAIMIKSGIPIVDALDTLSTQARSSTLRKVLNDILVNIKNGQTLAKSLQKHPEVFDQFYIHLIEMSEESGTLEENLTFLAQQLGKQYALQKKIQSAMLYPSIVLTTIGIVGAGLSLFILPNLVDLFKSLDVKLPLSTRILLFIADMMKNYGLFIIAGVIVFAIIVRLAIDLPQIRPWWDKLVLRLPIFGSFVENGQMASMCRSMGIMLKSGLPIRSALSVQESITTNYVYKKYIVRLQQSINKGKGLEEELTSGNFSHISPIAVRMIGVGEKTGKLDEILLYLADFFEDEVDDAAQNLSTVLEPFILLIIGLIVGFVALSIISPIYQLTGSIKR